MNDVAVVLDTNAYRDICDEQQVADPVAEIEAYIAACKERFITAFANPYVIMELAAHLADASDPNFEECRQAICAQHRLCAVSNENRTIRILSDSETQVLRALHQVTLPDTDATTQRLCTLSLHVLENTPGTLDPAVTTACQELATHVEFVENQFVADIWQYVVQELNPSSTGWAPLQNDGPRRDQALAVLRSPTMPQTIAKAFVLKAMLQAQVTDSPEEITAKADFLQTTFPGSVQLYAEILKRIVETGCNLERKNRANWIWDIQIALGIGQQIETVNQELHLVTTDGAIVNAAGAVGCEQYVHTLDDFKVEIDL